MTSLERRALLGDKKAQEECTEKGIVLPCPCCNGQASVFFDISTSEEAPYCCKCFDCDLEIYEKTEKKALIKWNTRPTPPIRICGECAMFRYNEENEPYCKSPYGLNEPDETNFCGNFMSKEEQNET